MSVRHIATRAKWYNNTLLVTCNEDGTIPLNSRIVLEVQEGTPVSENWRTLIAAAPDLLEALRPFSFFPCEIHNGAHCSMLPKDSGVKPCYPCAARAAIARAEGRGA